MNKNIIWVMDSDLCEECGQLLSDWGYCEFCGWSPTDVEMEDEDDPWWDEQDEDDWQEMARTPAPSPGKNKGT